MQLSLQTVRKFHKEVYDYYRAHGRHNLPWRKTKNPYQILVSEVMLQQTQVARVIPKYKNFLRQFPDIKTLAGATRADVLRAWSGLGYNRRALSLHRLAQVVVHEYGGKIPHTAEELVKLPGVGHATSASIRVFAWGEPTPFIETNIRTVFLHCFFLKKRLPPRHSHILQNVRMSWGEVCDKEILALVEQTLDRRNPREWCWALMDYGAMIKEKYGNPNVASAQYAKQSPFKNSNRQIRGAILKLLVEREKISTRNLSETIHAESGRIKKNIRALLDEGFIQRKRGFLMLAR